MADEPQDAVIRILQQIQATLAEHGRLHEQHQQAFVRIERRLDEMSDSAITALGLASHSNVRHNTVQAQLDDLRRRLEKLEENA
jgi:hypothetical protein